MQDRSHSVSSVFIHVSRVIMLPARTARKLLLSPATNVNVRKVAKPKHALLHRTENLHALSSLSYLSPPPAKAVAISSPVSGGCSSLSG